MNKTEDLSVNTIYILAVIYIITHFVSMNNYYGIGYSIIHGLSYIFFGLPFVIVIWIIQKIRKKIIEIH